MCRYLLVSQLGTLRRAGQTSQAMSLIDPLVSAVRESGVAHEQADADWEIGKLYVDLGESDLARQHLQSALEHFEAIGNQLMAGRIYREMARLDA